MDSGLKDVILNDDYPNELLLDKHIQYIIEYSQKKDGYEYTMTEHFRMSGIFWGLSAIGLLGHLDKLNGKEIVEFIRDCKSPSGGYAPCVNHDPHILYTLSAVQILILLDALHEADRDAISGYIKSLQNADGSFCGDVWGEVDTRFSFCAVACLVLIDRLSAIDVDSAVEFVIRCQNADGGFGTRPGSESHAGQIYCCVGVLSLTGQLHRINADALGWWLSERQLQSGGLNGRPEKLPDVCYSWWVLASLSTLGRLHWINRRKMVRFILATQDAETGGFTDRPGDMVDLFHTLFGLAGLSLLARDHEANESENPADEPETPVKNTAQDDGDATERSRDENLLKDHRSANSNNSSIKTSDCSKMFRFKKLLKKVNPVFCMPQDVIQKLGIEIQAYSL